MEKMSDKREKAHGINVTSMKRAFMLLWHGLTALLAGITNWFTVVLGMRDESKYGKFIQRVVGGSFALIMLLLALTAGWDCCNRVFYRWLYNPSVGDDYYEYGQYISRNVSYYSCGGTDGYVKTADGKTTISDIRWIAKPLGADSLVCYSDGEKRGYFNMFTGKPAIKAKYDHAWIFSDGLASVDDEGWIKFIDAEGKVVIDPKIPYIAGAEGYVFHGGHCVLHNNRRDKFGMIDKRGNWVMKAECDRIMPVDTFYIVSKDGMQSVITHSMDVVLPFIDASLWVSDGKITAEMADHTLRQYDLQGNLTDDFLISGVDNMVYETGELRYAYDTANADDLTGEPDEMVPVPVYETARCKCYEASSGWYGLMSPDGRVLTNPVYSEITAIGYDLYLCKKGYMSGEVLNGKGMKVK